MEIRDILRNLRESHHLTQDQMAERVMVTRQAVSRWENGETQPNTDTLKLNQHTPWVAETAYLPVLRDAIE